MSDQQGWTAPGPVPPDGNGPQDRPWTGYGPGYRPPPPPPPPPRLEYRPGIIPLRPLTLGEIWSGVFAAVRGNPGATLGLALVTTAAVLVPATALALWLAGQDLRLGVIFETDPDLASDPFLNATVASYLPALAMFIASILLPVFIALVIGHAVQGQKVTLAQTWQQSRGRILTAVATTFLVIAMFVALVVALIIVLVGLWATDSTGLAAGGTVVAIVAAVTGGIYLWVKVGFAVTIVVLEGAGARRSIARSWRLTRGRPFWRIFGIRLLTSIVASGIYPAIVQQFDRRHPDRPHRALRGRISGVDVHLVAAAQPGRVSPRAGRPGHAVRVRSGLAPLCRPAHPPRGARRHADAAAPPVPGPVTWCPW